MKKLLIAITLALFMSCSYMVEEEDVIITSEIGMYNNTENDVQVWFVGGTCSIHSSTFTIPAMNHFVFTDVCVLESEEDFNYDPYEVEVVTVDSTYIMEITKIRGSGINISF